LFSVHIASWLGLAGLDLSLGRDTGETLSEIHQGKASRCIAHAGIGRPVYRISSGPALDASSQVNSLTIATLPHGAGTQALRVGYQPHHPCQLDHPRFTGAMRRYGVFTLKLFLQNWFASFINTVNLEDIFCQIDTNGSNLDSGCPSCLNGVLTLPFWHFDAI